MLRKNSNYLLAFYEAMRRYMEQTDRPGYQPTIFSWIRHSLELQAEHYLFEKELKLNPDDQHKDIIIKWLKNPIFKSNNHSFRTYLIDVLIQAFPDDDWQSYDLKKIIFYSPDLTESDNPMYLYRGTLQQPDDAFKNGMESKFKSRNIEDYAEAANYSAGVSTSKSARVADYYSSLLKMDHYGVNEFYGFLYQIHYRGNDAIDIDKTQRARLTLFPEKGTKQEVNILSRIPPEDIVGYGYLKDGQYVEIKRNPAYDNTKVAKAILGKREFLELTFKQ